VFSPDELTTLELQSDKPLGFFAWFRQRFFSLSEAPHASSDTTD